MHQDNSKFKSFLKIWAVVIVLNQMFFFNGCFAIHCLLAAAPHTGFIAFLISPFFSFERLISFITTFIEGVKTEVNIDEEYPDNAYCNKCNKKFDLSNSYCIYCGESLQILSQEEERRSANNAKQKKENEKARTQLKNHVMNNFDGLLIALLSHICFSDGEFSAAEKYFIDETYSFLSQLREDNSEALLEVYNNIFEESYNSDINAICKRLSSENNLSEEILLTILLDLAHVDGEYHEREENIILKVVHLLDIDFFLYKNILSKYQIQNTSEGNSNSQDNMNFNPTLDESYEILEANKNMSFSEVKKNYRRLVRLYHTDTLSSKNLPSELMTFSENKLKSINAAYKKIKNQESTYV